jgi:hypothetical protein
LLEKIIVKSCGFTAKSFEIEAKNGMTSCRCGNICDQKCPESGIFVFSSRISIDNHSNSNDLGKPSCNEQSSGYKAYQERLL